VKDFRREWRGVRRDRKAHAAQTCLAGLDLDGAALQLKAHGAILAASQRDAEELLVRVRRPCNVGGADLDAVEFHS
jgi:microcystin degradation protein MlrC